MKKNLFFAGLVAVMAAACSSECPQADGNRGMEETEQTRTLVFRPFAGMDVQVGPWKPDDGMKSLPTRAALQEAADSLLCLDFMEGTMVKRLSQPADRPFSIEMRYGAHNLYFVGHSSTDYSVDAEKAVFRTEKVTESFLKLHSMEVSPDTEERISVEMDRVVSKLTVLIEDAIPDYVKGLRLTVGDHMAALDLNTGKGVAEEKKEFVISWELDESYAGRVGLKVSVFTFCPDGEFKVPVKIEATDADGTVRASCSASQIPLLVNRCTVARCRLFVQNGGFTFDAPGDWIPEIEVEM